MKRHYILTILPVLIVGLMISCVSAEQQDSNATAIPCDFTALSVCIRPAGFFTLNDPLDRQFVHEKEKKDTVQIPDTQYNEEAPADEELLTGVVTINKPMSGRYQLKINRIPGKDYILEIKIDSYSNDNKNDVVLLTDVPIRHGMIHVYDFDVDSVNCKIKLSRKS